MKIDEVKLRINQFVQGTIDLYMPPTNFIDKMKNATAKLWVDQNMWKLYKAIDNFGDQNDEIDIESVDSTVWFSISQWGKETKLIPSNYRSMAYTVAQCIKMNRQLTKKQEEFAKEVLVRAYESGFKLEDN